MSYRWISKKFIKKSPYIPCIYHKSCIVNSCSRITFTFSAMLMLTSESGVATSDCCGTTTRAPAKADT